MLHPELIAADLWGWLIPAVFIVIYLLNHILTAAKPGQQQKGRRVPPGERPLRGQEARQQAGQSQLNTEIEQFLKRANERRIEKARRDMPGRQALAAPPAEEPLDVEPLERHDFDAVEESVREHFKNRGFQQRANHLADDIGHADEEMEEHRKQVFEHRLGRLEREVSTDPNAPRDMRDARANADPAANAKAIAGLLANQQNIRQAVLLREILERPVDRW